jgi:hypothetical protein
MEMKNAKNIGETIIDGKTIIEWEREWRTVEGGFTVQHPELIGKAGLFRANLRGHTAVIGKAAGGWRCRLTKRISDFCRPSSSGRNHKTGRFIHDHQQELELQVLVTGSDRHACELANRLKTAMTYHHSPSINVPENVIKELLYPKKRT